MATAACLPIAADRAGPCVRHIFFEGLDLTGVTLAAEMRLAPETPGPASISLGMGATANAEGLRLVDVSTVNGIPTSHVVLRVNETTMEDAAKVPYSGELGTPSTLHYDLIGIFGQDKRRLAYGTFTALPTVYGMSAAPADRPQAYAGQAPASSTWTSARLTFTDDQVTIKVDGADLLGGQVVKATEAADDADTSRVQAAQSAAATAARFDEAAKVLPQTGGPGVGFDYTDANGRTYFGVDPDSIRHPEIDALRRGAGDAMAGGDEVGMAAPDGTLKWSISDERIRHPEMREVRGAAGLGGWDEVRVTGEIVGVPIFGASHSGGLLASPVISTTPSAYALTFAGGVRPHDGSDPFGPLKALVEQTVGEYGETIASGMAEMIAQLLGADGITAATSDQRPLFSSSGEKGTPIATLADETSSLAVRFKAAIANGVARANDQRLTYAPLCIPFPAGSTDIGNGVSGEAWKASARKLRRWAEAHANAVCGTSSRRLPMLIAQQSTHPWYGKTVPTIALAQLELARDDAFIGLACPCYIFPQGADNLHFSALGEKWLGAVMGFYAYQWFWRGVKITPLVPTASRQGDRLILRFPVRSGRRLVIDTTTVPTQPNCGVTAVDGSGNAIGLSYARISGRDTLVLEGAAGLGPGSRIRIGWQGSAYNGLTNLRDDDPTVFDPNGLALPIRQWAPISEVTL